MIDAHELGNIDIIRRLIKGQTDYVNVTNVTSYVSVYTGLVGTGTTGTNVTMTLNSNGLALSVDPPGAGGGAALRGSGTYSQNSGTVQFANSNDITFGLSSDGIMTASFSVTGPYLTTAAASGHTHSDLYQITGAYLTTAAGSGHTHSDLYQGTGAYLTTAMASDAGSLYQSAGAYLTTAMASDAGSLYQSAGAYLTTAMASDAGSLYQSAGAYLTTAMASDAGSLYQSAGAYLTTAAGSDHTHSDLYQSTGAYLTTAMASGAGTNFMGLNTAVTGASMTGNSSGMSLNIPQGSLYLNDANGITFGASVSSISTSITASYNSTQFLTTAAASGHTHSDLYQSTGAYLTTAAQSGHTHSDVYQSTGAYLTTAALSGDTSKYAGIGTSLTSTGGTDLAFTLNTNGLSLNVPKWITTYATGAGGGDWAVATVGGTDLAVTTGAATNTIYYPKWIITAALSDHTHSDLYQATGAYLTTAAQSGHTHSDLYQSTGAYLTTAAQSGHTHSDIYQSTGAYLTTAAQSGHTHSDIYQSTGAYLTTAAQVSHDHGTINWSATSNSTETIIRLTSNSSGFTIIQPSFITTAAASGHTHSDLYIPLAGSSAYQTATLAGTFMDKSYSSAFQTATLAGTFMDKSYSSAFQTATLAGTFMDKSYSSAFQTATLASTFVKTADSSLFQHTSATSVVTSAAFPSANTTKFVGSGTTIATTSGIVFKVTANSDGLNISYPAAITTGALSDHTHSDLYIPLAGSSAYQTATLAGTFMDKSYSSAFQTATLAGTFMDKSYSSGFQTATLATVLMPLANSSAFQTATLAGTFMDKSYSSAFQTATLAGTFMDKSYSSGFQTATLATVLMPLANSSAFQTATLAGTFMDKSYSSAFQTATLAGTFMDKSYSSAFQTATLAGTFMDKSYSSAFQTATLAGTFMDKSYSSAFQTATLAGTFMNKSYSSAFQTATLAGTFAQISNKAGIGTTVGATNGTLLKVTLNTDGINISMPAYITTAMASDAGTPTVGGNLYYSDGSGISWASEVAGSTTTMKASVVTSYLSGSLVNTSVSNSFMRSWELEGANTAGTTGSLQSSILYLSGGNNVTLSGNSNTIVISAGGPLGTQSWYANNCAVANSQTVKASSNSWIVFPFILSNNMSISILRALVSAGQGASTTMGTSTNTVVTALASQTYYAVLYSQGVGANSRSLQYITSAEQNASQSFYHSASNDATRGSYYTQYYKMTLPTQEGTSTTQYAFTKETSRTRIDISASYSSALTGLKWLDFPFATSLSQGVYWMAFGASITSDTNAAAGTRFLSCSHGISHVGVSQPDQGIGYLGQATAAGNNSLLLNMGLWTTNAQGTTNSINLAQVSTSASHVLPYFKFLREG